MTAVGEGIAWTPELKFSTGRTVIDADSYNEWVFKEFPMLEDMEDATGDAHPNAIMKCGVKISNEYYLIKNVMEPYTMRNTAPFIFMPPRMEEVRNTLETFQGSKRGEVCFTDTVYVPVLIRVQRSPKVVMSATPMEIMSMRYGIKRSTGNTIVGGMGIGWLAKNVLRRKKVKHVTVVDIDEGVLNYWGKYLRDEFGDKVTLVHADIYDYLNEKQPEFDRLLMDIWDSNSNWEFDRKFREVRNQHESIKLWWWGSC